MAEISTWAVVVGVSTPIAIDLALEPWRISFFVVYCILLALPVFLIWALAAGLLKE